jgi:hypothetical protein
MVNPNYPVIEELWGPIWSAAGASIPATRWVNLADRTLTAASIKRGKQYELDQPQSGEYSVTLGSQDGVLDPTNTSGPYGGRILPYQPYRRRAQWPPTANMLTPEIATGGEGSPAGAIPASFNMDLLSPTRVTSTISNLGSGVAWQGVNAFRFSIANATPASSGIWRTEIPAIRPGKRVTFSAMLANNTASTTTSMILTINFRNADGSGVFGAGSIVSLVGASGTPGWQRVTVSATAPTTGAVYGMYVGMNVNALTTAASDILVDGMQLEWGNAATTWVSPGTWYPMFSGFTERWPSQWAEGGTFGQVSPTAVDTFALLSQVTLKDIFLEEIKSRGARFFYTLADGAGSTVFADSTGNFPPAPLVYSKAGTGGWTAGNAVSSASASGGFIGSTGSVVTANPSGPGFATPGPATVLDLTGAGINGPATAAWTRMIAFRTSTNPTGDMVLWEGRYGGDGTFDSHARLIVGNGGSLILLANANNEDASFSARTLALNGLADGNWHLVMFGFDGAITRWALDGIAGSATETTPPTAPFAADYIGAAYFASTKSATNAFKGDLAFVTEFPSLLSAADMGSVYAAWRTAASGETSGARYSRILRYSGYSGASNVGTGMTTSMGPATDLGGSDVMSALNSVADTESGQHFVAADGTIVFQGRNARYSALAPVLTFGDGAGELPFEELQLDFDSTHLSNVAAVTQTPTGSVFTAQDAASVSAYYTRTLTRSLNTLSAGECQDAADYFVGRYKGPLTRVQSLRLHPSAVPSLWPVLLSLELGTRVRINRRPPGAPLVSVDCFVEQISWDMDGSNEAWVTLQCSPVDPAPYATFGAWHTTLNGASSVGATSITINAPADNINPLAAQITPGQQIVVGQGGAVPETMTVLSAASTGSPWTTGTLTFTAPLAHSHTNGFALGEPLPAGVTDPATWDATQQFDKTVFAY